MARVDRRPWFQLGSLSGNKQHVYTALPPTWTIKAALDQQAKRPHRHANDVIYKYTPSVSGGVVYGYQVDILSALDGAMLVPWRKR